MLTVKYIERLWTLYKVGEQANTCPEIALMIIAMRAYRCALLDSGAMDAMALQECHGLEEELLERYCEQGGDTSLLTSHPTATPCAIT